MNKEDVKKLDEITAEEASVEKQEATDVLTSDDLEKINGELADEELDQVNGGGAITPAVIRRDYFNAHRKK